MSIEKISELLKVIEAASAEMTKRGDVLYLGRFNTCRELGRHIELLRTEIAAGYLERLPELQLIFAPTSQWDDAGGSPDIANSVYQLSTDVLVSSHK